MRAIGTKFGRMSILICNDAWQPMLGFLAVQEGARMLLVPTSSSESSFPGEMNTTERWHDITRFHAGMLECYVVFVNRVGTEGDLVFWGSSHVVDPLGNVVVKASLCERALVTADLDVQSVPRRRKVPLLREARLGRLVEEGGDLKPFSHPAPITYANPRANHRLQRQLELYSPDGSCRTARIGNLQSSNRESV